MTIYTHFFGFRFKFNFHRVNCCKRDLDTHPFKICKVHLKWQTYGLRGVTSLHTCSFVYINNHMHTGIVPTCRVYFECCCHLAIALQITYYLEGMLRSSRIIWCSQFAFILFQFCDLTNTACDDLKSHKNLCCFPPRSGWFEVTTRTTGWTPTTVTTATSSTVCANSGTPRPSKNRTRCRAVMPSFPKKTAVIYYCSNVPKQWSVLTQNQGQTMTHPIPGDPHRCSAGCRWRASSVTASSLCTGASARATGPGHPSDHTHLQITDILLFSRPLPVIQQAFDHFHSRCFFAAIFLFGVTPRTYGLNDSITFRIFLKLAFFCDIWKTISSSSPP